MTLIDANLLLSAVDASAPAHAAARVWLDAELSEAKATGFAWIALLASCGSRPTRAATAIRSRRQRRSRTSSAGSASPAASSSRPAVDTSPSAATCWSPAAPRPT